MIAGLSGMIGLAPDLTIVLDICPQVAKTRLQARRRETDRYERMDPAFHARVRAGFRAIAEADPARCVLIPADRKEQDIHSAISALLEERFVLVL